ncbi:non-lysosomal glucosylceramidase isoform X1 [Hydra vulgaris]|uniref:non-lysosomal glucosylceramidase isoform X1 n=1 Tax=Hydra vulgaris TaxID=6087 RepID=UPI001F5E8EB0|nr:non-lysosomal glucosylceramidase [Hydra vulgaris]XP_047139398.1 non-lysosomal glucosylceramidase [Hydra vulgaris]
MTSKSDLKRHIPPLYGWRVNLDHEFSEKPKVFVFPRLSQARKLAGMAFRYMKFTRKVKKKGKLPFIDPYAVSACKQIYGVPLGGIGAGSIGRGWKGDFNRWQLRPGIYTYDTVDVNQFTVCIRKCGKTIYQQVLAPYYPVAIKNVESLQSWTWSFDGGRGYYHALYPRAWTVYHITEHNIKLTCRQVSPIFPDNYKDTSLPVGVFVWTIENIGMHDLDVSIMLTFQNGDGTNEDCVGGHNNEEFFCKGVYSEIRLQKDESNASFKIKNLLNGFTRSDNVKVQANQYPNSFDDSFVVLSDSDDDVTHFEPKIDVCHIFENKTCASQKLCHNNDSKNSSAVDIDINLVDLPKDDQKVSEKKIENCCNNLMTNSDNNFLLHEMCEIHNVRGVLMKHNALKKRFTLAIAALQVIHNTIDVVQVSTKVAFDAQSPAAELWEDLNDDGVLDNKRGDSCYSYPGQLLAAAVAAKTTVHAGAKQDLKFVLSWDQPFVTFGSDSGLSYCRRYTRFFGSNGNASPSLCCYALQNIDYWEDNIERWQNPILNDSELPAWFKSALFNELYFISDGGTVWLDIKRKKDSHGNFISDLVKLYGRFAYLEGHEYRMYNTYDVHFYASWALALLWPNLQISMQYDICNSVLNVDDEKRPIMMEGGIAPRKVIGCVPHDLGDPDDEPFVRVNAYCIHDTSQWKDLNLHFVLQVYRDFYITKNKQFLMDMWPAMKAAMAHSLAQDIDGDGIIENSGIADSTFDTWVVTGPSAYTGGLWLSALRCIIEIAHILGLSQSISKYKSILERGKKSYEKKLWNGTYYNYDGSENDYHNCIMAGQCAGQWYLHACDLGQTEDDLVFRPEQVHSTLKVIFQNNVMRFEDGFMGAVNGMRADGTVDKNSLQAEEVWTGVTYALAATMIQHGMVREGFRTAEGIYRTVYEKWGLGFQTPEAITANKTFRSRGYMRPLSIWSIYHAYSKRVNSHKGES